MQKIPIDNLIYYQFRKDDSKQTKDPYFWGGVEREEVNNLVQNILDSSFTERRKSTLLENVKEFLEKQSNKCLSREQAFVQAVYDQSQQKTKVSLSFPKLESDKSIWQEYVRNFHNTIFELLNLDSDIQNLLEIFRDGDFISGISGQVSAMSSTLLKGSEVTYEEFFDDLAHVFFTDDPEKQSILNIPKEKNKGDFLQFINKYHFPEKVKSVINDRLSSADFDDNAFSEAISNAIFSQLKEGQKTLTKGKITGRDKAISENLEKTLKKIFLQSLRNILPNKEYSYTELTPANDNPYNVSLKLRPVFSEQEGSYSAKVSIGLSKLKEQNTKQAKEEAFQIFWNFIGNNLPEGQAKILWTGKGDKHKFQHLKQIAYNAVYKNFNKDRANADAITILSAYGTAQLKGLLGELATAIQFAFLKDTRTTITGSEVTSAGQLSFDVAIKIANDSFGIQVKNFNKVQFSKFYSTSFEVSNENNMIKYFSKEGKEKYYFLFANGKMLKDTKIIRGDLKQKTIESFYNYIDNFLRISAGDLEDTFDITRSDVFIVKDMIIPSSYFFSLIYQKINQAKPTQFFDINGEFLSPPLLKNNEDSIKITNNLFKNLTISFSGITSAVNLKI